MRSNSRTGPCVGILGRNERHWLYCPARLNNKFPKKKKHFLDLYSPWIALVVISFAYKYKSPIFYQLHLSFILQLNLLSPPLGASFPSSSSYFLFDRPKDLQNCFLLLLKIRVSASFKNTQFKLLVLVFISLYAWFFGSKFCSFLLIFVVLGFVWILCFLLAVQRINGGDASWSSCSSEEQEHNFSSSSKERPSQISNFWELCKDCRLHNLQGRRSSEKNRRWRRRR